MTPSIRGDAVDGVPDSDVEEALDRELAAEDERVDRVLRDFSDFSGRGAATTGRALYDIARDAEGPITVGEIVDRWVAQASGAALAHARRYAEHRRTKGGKLTRANARARSDAVDARQALRNTLRWMIRKGSLKRLDGATHERGLWAALVVPGRPPLVHIAEGKVGAYDDDERARRERVAEGERARARGAGLARPLERADEAVVHRLAMIAHRELASLIEEANGSDPRGHGNRAGALLGKFAGGRSRLELVVVLEECDRELLRRGVREPGQQGDPSQKV
jgi:hypothetical protein